MPNTRSDPTSSAMAYRLFRSLISMLVAITLLGAVQAAARPWHGACAADMTNHVDTGPLPAPCDNMVPACTSMLTCFSNLALPSPRIGAGPRFVSLSVIYWGDNLETGGLSVEPDLGPPIAI